MDEDDYKFEGNVPDYYDKLFGSQLFEPYAVDLVSHLSSHTASIGRVLELSCGTGRCTRQILAQIKGPLELTATDVSQEMLDFAKKAISVSPQTQTVICWKVADECELPFEENYFDLVICQFGFMFGADKEKAFAESMRVLLPGGLLLFNVWDDIEKNPLCFIADNVIKASHPDDHDDFFRLPYSMHDREVVASQLTSAGLDIMTILDEPIKCFWNTPFEAADAIIDGSPISLILKSRGEDLKPTLDKISAAYLEHKEQESALETGQVTGTTADEDRISFTMNAVIYMSCKPNV